MAEQPPKNSPTHDELDELLLSCRYGDLEDVQAFVTRFGWDPVAEIRDESGNTVLHMICGNGHLDLLDYMLPHIPMSLLEVENTTGRSTPLHWAAVNAHLTTAQALVLHPGGPGARLIDAHNAAGLSPLGEAELAGADDVAKWLVEVMTIRHGEMVEGEDTEEMGQETGKTDDSEAAERATNPSSARNSRNDLESRTKSLSLTEQP